MSLADENAEQSSMVAAIERSMAVIEFRPDGTIIRANAIFLQVMGYRLEEVMDKHHRMFVDKEEADHPSYTIFWARLAAGDPHRGQFKRIAKSGEPVWLEASYNPIFDAAGRLTKVVKFAYDITESHQQGQQLEKALADARETQAEMMEAERMRRELDDTLQQMSTPVTPIWEGILMLPLIGFVDSTRTDDVMRKTLGRISQTGAKMFILDISGVPTVDTAVANQLIKITKATKIMGCETLVSGVSSEIAHTIVELGVDLAGMQTTSTLRDALAMCLEKVESQKKKGKKKRKRDKS